MLCYQTTLTDTKSKKSTWPYQMVVRKPDKECEKIESNIQVDLLAEDDENAEGESKRWNRKEFYD